MNIKRKALIIGVPKEVELNDVRQRNFSPENSVPILNDCECYINFLHRQEGGCWSDEEISYLKNNGASLGNILTEVNRLIDYDFTLTIFVGHGSTRDEKQALGAWGAIPFEVDKLKNRSKRQLIIIDACSSSNAIENVEIKRDPDLAYRKLPEYPTLNIQQSKRLYLDQIIKCEPDYSQCILYAAGIGQSAVDDNNAGLFSGSIRRQTIKWLEESICGDILTTQKLFDILKSYFQQKYPSQNPRIEGHLNLPFAVNPGFSTISHE